MSIDISVHLYPCVHLSMAKRLHIVSYRDMIVSIVCDMSVPIVCDMIVSIVYDMILSNACDLYRLHNNLASSTGCNLDEAYVWSGTSCSVDNNGTIEQGIQVAFGTICIFVAFK